jgi:hypothetical protein
MPRINIIITASGLLARVRAKKDIASRNVIQSRNLYPPILLNMLGARRRATIEVIEPRAYIIPTNFSPINDARKLELI